MTLACETCGRLLQGGRCRDHPIATPINVLGADVPRPWRDAALRVGHAEAMVWVQAPLLLLATQHLSRAAGDHLGLHAQSPRPLDLVLGGVLLLVHLGFAARGIRKLVRLRASPMTPAALRPMAGDAVRRAVATHAGMLLIAVAAEAGMELAVHGGWATSHTGFFVLAAVLTMAAALVGFRRLPDAAMTLARIEA